MGEDALFKSPLEGRFELDHSLFRPVALFPLQRGETRHVQVDFDGRSVLVALRPQQRLLGPVDHAHHLCVTLFDVRRAVGRVGMGVDFALEPAQLVPSPAVDPQPFGRIKFHSRHGGK